MDAWLALLRDCLRDEIPVVVATVIEVLPEHDPKEFLPKPGAKIVVRVDEEPDGSFGLGDLDRNVIRDARGALSAGHSVVRHYGSRGQYGGSDVAVFLEVFAAPRRMLIFGAVDFTAALVRVAKVLGYHVTVCDARPVFATVFRFPEADEIVADWPHRYLAKVADQLGPGDAICVLTHDHKFDIPVLVAALDTDVGYVGAMGSRKTHESRKQLLQADGVDPERINTIMGPIGIDIGARTPEETAVAICAEIIALRAGIADLSLRDATGPIHRSMG